MRKLNLGCGTHWLPSKDGWDNIDVRDLVPPSTARFIKHDVRRVRKDLYLDGTIDEIFASDILEHMPKPHALIFLEDMVALLKKGGKITIRTPEFSYIMEWSKKHTTEEIRYRCYGWNDYPENSHCFVWLEHELLAVCDKLGLSVVTRARTEETNMTLSLLKR